MDNLGNTYLGDPMEGCSALDSSSSESKEVVYRITNFKYHGYFRNYLYICF